MLLSFLSKPLIPLIGGVIIAMSVVMFLLKAENDSLQIKVAALRGQLATCDAQMANIREAVKSDAEIPDDLRDLIPSDGWLLPEGG